MNDPESWRWVWAALAFTFAVGELLTPGSFILLPFALGAFLATISGFLSLPVPVEWALFLGASAAGLVGLRPLARHLDISANDNGVGARRLLGQDAWVLQAIPGDGELGLVRVGREDWRAESTDDSPIREGVRVRVADVRGTRVVVALADSLLPGDDVSRT